MATPPLPPAPAHDDEDDALPPGFPSEAERNWAVVCHLGGFAVYLLPFAFGHVLVPLGIWLWKRSESPFIDANGREALNFQISVTIYAIVAGVLAFVLVGFVLLAALAVFQFVLMVIASVRASQGEAYRYPFTLRLV
jgi:uncharacterized Tic20 family protein